MNTYFIGFFFIQNVFLELSVSKYRRLIYLWPYLNNLKVTFKSLRQRLRWPTFVITTVMMATLLSCDSYLRPMNKLHVLDFVFPKFRRSSEIISCLIPCRFVKYTLQVLPTVASVLRDKRGYTIDNSNLG